MRKGARRVTRMCVKKNLTPVRHSVMQFIIKNKKILSFWRKYGRNRWDWVPDVHVRDAYPSSACRHAHTPQAHAGTSVCLLIHGIRDFNKNDPKANVFRVFWHIWIKISFQSCTRFSQKCASNSHHVVLLVTFTHSCTCFQICWNFTASTISVSIHPVMNPTFFKRDLTGFKKWETFEWKEDLFEMFFMQPGQPEQTRCA